MTLRQASALAIALAALLATGTVASAGTSATVGRPPQAVLHLTIMADAGITATATLTCSPAGGSHPRAAVACVELARVNGDLDRLPAKGVLCPMIYQPVNAAAHGTWRGRVITWQHVYSNQCVMQASTGTVFAF